MNMQAILDRISRRLEDLGLTESAVAQKGKSRDVIRNWRRAVELGKEIKPRYDSLEEVAKALHVTPEWLIGGAGDPPAPAARPQGMAEQATPFTLAPHPTSPDDPQGLLRAIFGKAAATPALLRINKNLPAFELARGDVVLTDISRLPEPGEIAVVTIIDEDAAQSTTMICRYLPPYLSTGKIGPDVPTMRVDDRGVQVRYPVVGSIRGIPET
jgi:transcriptional regulator with XRE-family HTH domain